jgi:hypothetical protein
VLSSHCIRTDVTRAPQIAAAFTARAGGFGETRGSEIYRASLMTKMQAASLSELVRMALIAGLPEAGLQILHDPSPMSRGMLMG